MSSDLVIPVVQLENVRPHSNAEKLELCDVLGYQMVIPKGKYQSGHKAVYAPVDTCIPEELAVRIGVKTYLKGTANRVGAVQLRGEKSFGLILEIPEGQNWEVGENVAEFFGITKYIPPIKPTIGMTAGYDMNIDPYFQKYTDIQNGKIFTGIFQEGEEVIATEKIHGSNGRVGRIIYTNSEGSSVEQWVAGSHELRRKRPQITLEDGTQEDADFNSDEIRKNTFWYPLSNQNLRQLILSFGPVNVIVYGEIYGVQKGYSYDTDAQNNIGFRVFDINVNGRYIDYDEMKNLCDNFVVETVPVVARMPFDFNKIKELSDGKSLIGNHIREGVVVKPVKERIHPKIGRVVLKYVGDNYLLGRKEDFTDV